VKKTRIAFTDAALADILEQSDWYETQGDRSLAQRWEEAVTATLLRIAQRPRIGSRCSFTADELRGTRRLPVADFAKHLVFYHVMLPPSL
jgi:plasmid stabilization system protein ParE